MMNYLSSIWHKLLQPETDSCEIINADEFKSFFQQAFSYVARHVPQDSSKDRLLGEKPSVFNGRGMDYSESRDFVNGDDIRLINWKQSARSGELITNKYYQENDNIDYILLDQRHAMFFGTRQQPKVALAIKLGIISALSSIKHHKTIRVIELKNKIKLSPLMNSYEEVLIYFSTATKQQRSEQGTKQPDLSNSFKFIQSLRPVYSSVTIISDCNDINKNDINVIKALSSKNNLSILRVQDQIEKSLPGVYPVNYQSVSEDESITICNKSELMRLQKSISHINEKIFALLNDFKIPVTHFHNQMADEDIMKGCFSREN